MKESEHKVRLIPPQHPGQTDSTAAAISGTRNSVSPGLRRHKHNQEQLREGDGEILLPQSVYCKIMEHLSADFERELGGLLVGREIESGESRPGILIQDALPALHITSNETRLTFTEESWAEFDRELDAHEASGVTLQRVGWYHSHPKMDIFLSPWDLDVCLEFRRPTQVALVIDPVEPKGGFFIRGTEGFRDHSPQGFWEVEDVRPGSAVFWQDLTPGPALPRGLLSPLEKTVSPEPADQKTQQETPPTPVNTPSGPVPFVVSTSRLQWRLQAATLLVAVLLVGGLWWDREDRKTWMRSQETSEANQSKAIDDLKTQLEDLISKAEPKQATVPSSPAPIVPPAPAPPPTPANPKPPAPVNPKPPAPVNPKPPAPADSKPEQAQKPPEAGADHASGPADPVEPTPNSPPPTEQGGEATPAPKPPPAEPEKQRADGSSQRSSGGEVTC